MMLPRQVCLEGLKAEAEGGAKLDCLSIAKKPKVRHTQMDGSNGLRLEVRRQRRCRSGGKMSKRGLHIEMAAALNMEDT